MITAGSTSQSVAATASLFFIVFRPRTDRSEMEEVIFREVVLSYHFFCSELDYVLLYLTVLIFHPCFTINLIIRNYCKISGVFW